MLNVITLLPVARFGCKIYLFRKCSKTQCFTVLTFNSYKIELYIVFLHSKFHEFQEHFFKKQVK